jgi:hypothetical protein
MNDSIKFVGRAGSDVEISVMDSIRRIISLPTEKQAQLYEMCITGKVDKTSLDFAKGLVRAEFPTSKQEFWIEKFINPSTPASGTDEVDLTNILAMYGNARGILKRPKITLMTGLVKDENGNYKTSSNSVKVRFTLREDYGLIYLNGEGFGSHYGSIFLKDGTVKIKSSFNGNKQDLLDLIKEFAADPKRLVIACGKLTGHCCFCSLPLSDARSLHAGYGDTCAKNYRLPWGDKANSPEIEWVENQN